MNAGNQGSRTRSEINVTPLIDIVLVLLIVFIVLVPSLTKVLEVNIPIVKPPVVGEKDKIPPVVITLDQEGKLLLQSEEIQLGQLADRLTPVVQLQPMGFRKVFFKVDEDIPNQRAVAVLDQIRLASDRAKQETLVHNSTDNGGDVKVAITLKKRT